MSETAVVNYHLKSAEPQAFRFDVDGVVGNLVSPNLAPTKIRVQDLRNGSSPVEFTTDGITFEKHRSVIKNFCDLPGWIEIYNHELRSILAEKIGAKEVIVFDHTVRIDNPDADRKPARNVHNDYSPSGAEQRLVEILGEEKANEFQFGHYGFVNVWRPVEHPITSAPLGFIRPSSIKAEDWMAIELIYPDRTGQILGVAASDDHDWFYLSKMTPDEIVIFNIYDNEGRPFLGHSALEMDNKSCIPAPRKSIESRTVIRY